MGKIVLVCNCGTKSKVHTKVMKGVDYRSFICNSCLKEAKNRKGKGYGKNSSKGKGKDSSAPHYTRSRKE